MTTKQTRINARNARIADNFAKLSAVEQLNAIQLNIADETTSVVDSLATLGATLTHEDRTYTVIDNKTGIALSTHKTSRRAHAKADRLDSVYGAVRYIVRINWES